MTDPATSAFALSILKPLAGQVLERALNQVLALDAQTRRALTALDGRTLTLTLQSPPLAAQLRVDGERLRVEPVDAVEPDLAIHSTLGGMLAGLRGVLGKRNDAADAPAPAIGQVRMAGDVQLARELQHLLARFAPDWQRPFVAVFGETLGAQIADAFAAALQQVRNGGRMLAEGTAGYLTGTAHLIPARDELDAFGTEVAALDAAVTRLAARVARRDTWNRA